MWNLAVQCIRNTFKASRKFFGQSLVIIFTIHSLWSVTAIFHDLFLHIIFSNIVSIIIICNIYCEIDVGSWKQENSKTFLQWLVVNVPDNEFEKGEHVSPFMETPPRKQLGGKYHRTLFLVYLQPTKLKGIVLERFKR